MYAPQLNASSSGCRSNQAPTAASAPGRKTSSEFSQQRMSPEAIEKPRAIAADCPPSGSEHQKARRSEYCSISSAEPSRLPPSSTMYSSEGYCCSRTESIVVSTNFRWLTLGVTTVILGSIPSYHFGRIGLGLIPDLSGTIRIVPIPEDPGRNSGCHGPCWNV